jgi:hypothetical protein
MKPTKGFIMPLNWKTIAAISAGTVVIGAALSLHKLHRELYKDFPELDRKIVRKAFRKTMVNAVLGDYPTELSDAEVEAIFLRQVARIS